MVWAWRMFIKGINPSKINTIFPIGNADLPTLGRRNETKGSPKAFALKSKGLFMSYRFIKNSVNVKITTPKPLKL
jgi:hypothetical protein